MSVINDYYMRRLFKVNFNIIGGLLSAFSACALCTFICWKATNAITEQVDFVNCCLCVIDIAAAH